MKTFLCPRCIALRSIDSWRDAGPEIIQVRLAPCGHVIERVARLEWRADRNVRRRREYAAASASS